LNLANLFMSAWANSPDEANELQFDVDVRSNRSKQHANPAKTSKQMRLISLKIAAP